MKAVYITHFGQAYDLEYSEAPAPGEPLESQVLVEVRAAGVNRADLLQCRGNYPPPAGYSANIPGLEFAGEVLAIGENVRGWKPGDRVFGIVAGEGQAERVLTDQSHLARIPENLSFVEAAATPEAFITAYDAVFTQARLQPDETLLIHAVGSGVGLAALQLAKAAGATVIGTSRTAAKLDSAAAFGLDSGILVSDSTDFSRQVESTTNAKVVNVILDLVGSAYFEENLRSLAVKGRLVLVGLPSGTNAAFNMGLALAQRLSIIGTVLRTRTALEKCEVTRSFAESVIPLLAGGRVAPNVDQVFPVADVRSAYRRLESNSTFGKIVLEF